MERASFAGMVLGIALMFLKAASYRFDVINHLEAAMPIRAFKTLEHLVGWGGLAIVLDYFLFNGFCTEASSQALSHASSQIENLCRNFTPGQFIHQFF
jgi:uncharacterized membrane protein YjfL (UPF0719 family)